MRDLYLKPLQMKPSKEDVRRSELARKWLLGDIRAEEREEFSNWYNAGQDEPFIVPKEYAASKEEHQQLIFNKIQLATRENKSFKFYWLAAAVLLMVGVGLLFHFNSSSDLHVQNEQKMANDIKPGGNNAVLILANGKNINLAIVSKGEIAKQTGLSIVKKADGQLIYTVLEKETGTQVPELSYNTIATPKGGQYQIDLPDGTKVWINAASSLKYPTHFIGSERKVELIGEAYFEVAKDKTKPFKVITEKQEIQVLGTHFNVNAYNDESDVRTTLIEGTVKVHRNQSTDFKILKPGQQSILKGQEITVETVDVQEAIAWKNGHFFFNREEMGSSMRKIARWYNIEVDCKGNINDVYFEGSFPRAYTLKQILNILEKAGSFKFKIEGRRLIVTI